MKFTATREQILGPLQSVIGVVERKQTMPVLANVLLAAKGKTLAVTGTDLEVELVASGEVNVGQLLRERHGTSVFNVGFTTHSGRVTAASDWDEPAESKEVVPSLPGSYERLLHDSGIERFYLATTDHAVRRALREPRLERAIGVIYRPETERQSHYFHARLADQFDAVIHIDQTSAVTPLEPVGLHAEEELPETYPTSL